MAQIAGSDAGGTGEHDDLALALKLIAQPLGASRAVFLIGSRQHGGDLGSNQGIGVDDHNALCHGLIHSIVKRGRGTGDNDDSVITLGDHVLNIGNLLGVVAVGVGKVQLVHHALFLPIFNAGIKHSLHLLHP